LFVTKRQFMGTAEDKPLAVMNSVFAVADVGVARIEIACHRKFPSNGCNSHKPKEPMTRLCEAAIPVAIHDRAVSCGVG